MCSSIQEHGYDLMVGAIEVVVLDMHEARQMLAEFPTWCSDEVRALVLQGDAPLFGIIEGAHRVKAVQDIIAGKIAITYDASVEVCRRVTVHQPFLLPVKVLKRGSSFQQELKRACVANDVGERRIMQTLASDIDFVRLLLCVFLFGAWTCLYFAMW